MVAAIFYRFRPDLDPFPMLPYIPHNTKHRVCSKYHYISMAKLHVLMVKRSVSVSKSPGFNKYFTKNNAFATENIKYAYNLISTINIESE